MKKNFTLFVCLSALLISCSKDEFRDVADEKAAIKTTLTPAQELLKGKMNETALLVMQIAANPDVQQEVFNFVNMRYEGNYRVMFSHLLKPEELSKSQMPGSFSTGNFRDQFMKAAGGSITKGGKGAAAELVEYLVENDIELAWHYSQEWEPGETPTVTFNPLDNDSVNIGYLAKYDTDGELYYETVYVDDDYAFEHPVLIVDQHEELQATDPNAEKFLGAQDLVRTAAATGPWPDGTAKYNKVYLYQVRTTKSNFRGLFYGENNMYFRRAGSEVVLGPDKTFSTKVTIDRWAGRKGVWRTVNAVWDQNWQPEEVTQWIGMEAIHVHKDKTVKRSGDVSLKLELDNIVGPIAVIKPSLTVKLFGWEVTIDWKNEVWYDNNKTREEFFNDNYIDANRYGTKDSRCIYLAGSTTKRSGVFFTFDIESKNALETIIP